MAREQGQKERDLINIIIQERDNDNLDQDNNSSKGDDKSDS